MDLPRILYGDHTKPAEELGLVKEKQKNKNDTRFFFVHSLKWMDGRDIYQDRTGFGKGRQELMVV